VAKAARLASSEGEAAAAITASRPAAAEGPSTGAGCPAANAATKSGRIRILRIGVPYRVKVLNFEFLIGCQKKKIHQFYQLSLVHHHKMYISLLDNP
jgi:hypothetical protein